MHEQLPVLGLLAGQRFAVCAGDAHRASLPALGIEQDGEGPWVQRDVGNEERRLCLLRGTQGSVAQPLRCTDDACEFFVGYLVDLSYGGPGQYVVELVEEECLPGCFELFAGVIAAVERGQRGEGFRLEKPVLGLAV